MSTKELEKLGFRQLRGKLTRYSHIYIDKVFIIDRRMSVLDIMRIFYEKSLEEGSRDGYAKCQEDIRFLLQAKKEE